MPKFVFFQRFEERIVLSDLAWDETHIADEILVHYYGSASSENRDNEITRRKAWRARIFQKIFEMYPIHERDENRGQGNRSP